jgi:hypothetical protein
MEDLMDAWRPGRLGSVSGRQDQQRSNAMTRISLLERLKEIQQMPRYKGRDITTISAVLSNQALAKHIEVCEQAAGLTPQSATQANAA